MINNKLTWHDHVEYISSKASRRIYFLCIPRRAGKPPTDIIPVYTSVIRSVLEYACEVWHSVLNKEQSDTLEHLQKRALRIASSRFQLPRVLQTYRLYTKGEKPNVVSYLLPWKDQHTNCTTSYLKNKINQIDVISENMNLSKQRQRDSENH